MIYDHHAMPRCPRCDATFDEGCTDDCLDRAIQAQIDEAHDERYEALVCRMEDEATLLESRARMCKSHERLRDYADAYSDAAQRIRRALAGRTFTERTQRKPAA